VEWVDSATCATSHTNAVGVEGNSEQEDVDEMENEMTLIESHYRMALGVNEYAAFVQYPYDNDARILCAWHSFHYGVMWDHQEMAYPFPLCLRNISGSWGISMIRGVIKGVIREEERLWI
jgi:hypothetical protein